MDDIPPHIKPEDVARYVIERDRKRQQEAEEPQVMSGFKEMMKIAEKNGDYRNIIVASMRHIAQIPGDATGPFYLGLAHYYNCDFKDAQIAWRKAVRLDRALQPQIAPYEARMQRLQKSFPALEFEPIQMVPSDNSQQRQTIYDRGKSLILAKNYREIERLAAAYQKNQNISPDGHSWLGVFIEGVQFKDELMAGQAKGSDWKQMQARLQGWLKVVPNSVLARAALIESETLWAWDIRGGGLAHKVTEEQWAGVQEHLARAGKMVESLPKSGLQYPTVCMALLRWAHLSSVDESQIQVMWADIERRFPDSLDLALLWGLHLLPQWSGKPGDWEKFATSWADRSPGEAGDIRYAQFVLGMRGMYKKGEMWTKSQAQWPRLKKGLQALLKKHPQSIGLATILMQVAVEVGDSKTAQDTLLRFVRNRANSTLFASPREFALQRLKILDPVGG
jgi:tetratricopeptide (TPR) repeat protein